MRELELEIDRIRSRTSTVTTPMSNYIYPEMPTSSLDLRIASLVIDKEKAEQRAAFISSKLNELVSRLSLVSGVNLVDGGGEVDLSQLVKKVGELLEENGANRAKLVGLETGASALTMSQETIRRLADEVKGLEKAVVKSKMDMEEMKTVRVA